MDCLEFQQQLPELYGSRTSLADHPHVVDCENCAALVRDLEYIAEQAKFLLPIHDPSPRVWEKISASLPPRSRADDDPRRVRNRNSGRLRRCSRRRLSDAWGRSIC